ncbi:MAG: type VI secretion system tip protein VgrG [Proteobacteria bacterium]|nr:type VI secretion system tip protein VgrG [Pseudomonadota bacterium]
MPARAMASPISLKSPLPSKDLFFESMADTGGLSALGETQLGLLSEKPDIKAEDLLGKSMTVEVALKDGSVRHFNGLVARFGLGAHRGRYYGYQATVRPWLWFLTRTADCRVFQDLSVPDIVKKVFEDHPIAHFQFKLFRSYRPWVYCVQYRETDYNFVARLLEHEGIYWYFEHTADQHKLVLVDSHTAHDPAPGCASLPYYENPGQMPPDTVYVSNWSFDAAVRSGKTAATSYDFEQPSASLLVTSSQSRSHALDDYELFDFQGDYIKPADGTQYDEDRLIEQQFGYATVRGASNAPEISIGHVLAIEKHPRDDQNAKYLIAAERVDAHVDAYEGGDPTPGGYRCSFEAIPAAQQFRPPRHTPKPFVQGPQTAVVVGPSGEEIHTDKYGRVKVQFHWDRYGKKDDKSSCWVRVSHPWAGKNFGVMHVPRIGQEVVVSFLEGDPDQPLVTGRVYNAEQMPPWDLPTHATQSGILTRSSKGGAYDKANAIRFEDKMGSEQLWIHAEKNQDIEVEHDETHWVGNDRTKTIDHDETTHVKHDRTETVDNNETITIHGQRTEVVDKDETITIHQNRTETVDKEESITIHGGRTEKVDKDESITIDGGRTETVAKDESIAINGGRTETVAKDESITINGGRTESVAKDESVSVTGGRTVSIGKDDALSVGKNLSVTASESISLTTGSASIVMKKDGTITIKGKDVTIQGSGKINVKADSDVVVKGSKVSQN